MEFADKLKSVERASLISDGSRHENSGEHSWHVSLSALTLSQYAPEGTDIDKVIKLLIVHDLVEIISGDSPIFSPNTNMEEVNKRERDAVQRTFGKLPQRDASKMTLLWMEFCDGLTKEAMFAHCIDRVQPIILNLSNGGLSWKQQSVTYEMVRKKCRDPINNVSKELWSYLDSEIKKILTA